MASFNAMPRIMAAVLIGILFSLVSCVQDGMSQQQAGQAIPETKAAEVPDGLTANLNVTGYSQYIWRGLELSKDSLVIFPSITMGYKGFAVNLWADLDTNFNNPLPLPGRTGEFKIQETDLTVTYANSIQPLKTGFTFGWIFYDTDGFYGRRPTDNQELFLTLAPELPLNPTFSIYSEVQIATAWYFSLGLSHSFRVHKEWSLDVGGQAGYYYSKQEAFSSLHDANLSAGLKIPVSKHMAITPKMHYSFPLNSSAANRIKSLSFNRDHNQFFYGGIVFDYNIP